MTLANSDTNPSRHFFKPLVTATVQLKSSLKASCDCDTRFKSARRADQPIKRIHRIMSHATTSLLWRYAGLFQDDIKNSHRTRTPSLKSTLQQHADFFQEDINNGPCDSSHIYLRLQNITLRSPAKHFYSFYRVSKQINSRIIYTLYFRGVQPVDMTNRCA